MVRGKDRTFLAGLLVVLSALIVRFALSPLPGYDVRDFQVWAEAIALGGVTAIYHSDLLADFNPCNYPPLFLYILDLLIRLYTLFSSTFDHGSFYFGLLVKVPSILADAAAALTIYLFLRGRASPRLALAGALGYALNPALIWDTGYWGGIDAIDSFLALLAIVLLVKGLPEAAWVILTLSVLTKPLSTPIVIVATVVTILRFGLWRAVLSAAASLATAFVVVVPYLLAGTFGELVVALTRNVGNYNNISANAHNFWWLVSGGYGWTKDTDLLLGVVSYRFLGFALFGLFALWCLLFLRKHSPDSHVFGACALLSFGFYLLVTEVHENWMFGVFPFLAVACILVPSYRPVFVALTLTFWLNMALHELYFGYELPGGWLGYFLAIARMANAAANNLLLAYAVLVMLRSYRTSAMARQLALILRKRLSALG